MTQTRCGKLKPRARFTTSIAGARNILTSTTLATSSRGHCTSGRDGGFDRRDRGGARSRAEISAAHPLSGYFAPSRRGDQPGVPKFHFRIQLSGQISRRVSDQGEPVARSRGRNSRRGQGLRFWSRSRQQARIVRRPRAAKSDGQFDHLQRLQGRGIHQNGAARHQARKKSHHGCGKIGRTAPHHFNFKTTWRRAVDRNSRAAVEQGRGQMGRERRRKCEVRLEHGGTFDGDGNLEGGKFGALPETFAFSHRLAGAGHFDGEKGRAGSRAVLREAAQDGFRHRIHGCRRRTWRGLRRQPLEFRQLDELHLAGIHERHRLLHRRCLQRGKSSASDNHQRKRTRHRRASQRFDRGSFRLD